MRLTKRGKDLKIMAVVDRHVLPLSVSTHAANHHEVMLVLLSFDFYMLEGQARAPSLATVPMTAMGSMTT